MPSWNECSIYEDACRNRACDHTTNKPRTAVTVPQRIIDVVTDRGIPFRVVYGNRAFSSGAIAAEPTVSFYDTRYTIDSPLHAHGQFVADYSVEDMLEHDKGYGLRLYGDSPMWTVDGSTMALVRLWLVHLFLAQ